MMSAYLNFRRSLLLFLVIVLLLNGCDSSTSAPPVPVVPPEVNQLSAEIQSYVDRYNKEFALRPRPAVTAQAAAEAYMERYQPGPLPRIFQSSYIYDRHGALISEVLDEGRRTWVTLDQISPFLRNAVVATEDASFYRNTGVDAIRVVGAFMKNAQAGGITSGASTITMQLARNLFFEPARRFDQSMDRKVFEILMAHDLTDLFTKDELLEMYLNVVYFGHRAYGPEAAAQAYFGKSAAKLTMAEATLLAGLPQQPGELDLFRNMAGAKQRQRIVLDLMVKREYLTAKEADAVWKQPVKLASDPDLQPHLAPHFVTYLQSHLNKRFGPLDLKRAGLHITTTLDLKMQSTAEKIVAQTVARLRPTYDLSNAALVALQPGTAQLLVMVGSANYADNSIRGAVNVATSLRQPGSSIKPILYATAFNDNLISPTSILWDLPVGYQVTSYQVYRPGNYDGRFRGPVTVRMALANSLNVPAVKLLDRVGIDRMRASAHAMGITAFDRNDVNYGLGLTLGSNELTLLELATAYHTISNSGQYLPAEPILSISNGVGEPILQFQHAQPVQAITADAAYLVSNIMSDNVARTPEFGPNSALKISRPAAVKTGTTNSWRDNWTLGFTKYLLAGVWAGNSDGHPMRGISGITGAAPIWHDFMEAVIADPAMLKTLNAAGDPAQWELKPPASVLKRQAVCPKNIGCRADGEYYSQAWAQKMGEGHLQEDSLVTTKFATVWLGQDRRVGVCADTSGKQNTVYRLPSAIGQLAPTQTVTSEVVAFGPHPSLPGPLIPPTLSGPTRYYDPAQVDFSILPKRLQEEQKAVLNWSYRSGLALYLGPCDDVTGIVQGMFGKDVRTVTIQTPSTTKTVTIVDQQRKVETGKSKEKVADTSAPTPRMLVKISPPTNTPQSATTSVSGTLPLLVPTATPQPIVQPTPQPTATATAVPEVKQPVQPGQGSGYYAPVAVIDDASCPGNYILGQVQNTDGAPVAGVHLIFVDQWGNRGEAVSKNSGADYGNYDFPIGVDTAREIRAMVVDEAGNPLSPTVVIEHRQGADADAPCHHVIWRQN